MLKHKDEIVARIHHFVEEQLLPAVPLPSMVIDFALAYPRPEGEDFKVAPPIRWCFSLFNKSTAHPFIPASVDAVQVYVVELNPFAEFAGTGLFIWTEDFATLTGQAPFEYCSSPNVAQPDAPAADLSAFDCDRFRAQKTEPEGALQRMGSNWILPDFVREQ